MNNHLRRDLAIIAASILFPLIAQAQVPPRFYWKSLAGGNAVPMIYQSFSGNSNPLDPAYLVSSAEIDAEVLMAGYAKLFPLFGRTATVAVLAPMGRVSSSVNVASLSGGESSRGFGDPTLELGINLVGPGAIMNIPDLLRYEPRFSLDLVTDFMLPVGEYDDDQSLNLGQNRWYGRVGTPMIWQYGPWVPGQRTTIEILPWVYWFGNNSDFLGETLSTDPMFQVEAHFTRDLTSTLWASLDAAWMTGGESTVAGTTSDSIDNLGIGFTVGYQINDNLSLTLGYMSTISDSDPSDLQLDVFRLSLNYGWHKIVEGGKRLHSGGH